MRAGTPFKELNGELQVDTPGSSFSLWLSYGLGSCRLRRNNRKTRKRIGVFYMVDAAGNIERKSSFFE
jgi:hypothetical protein